MSVAFADSLPRLSKSLPSYSRVSRTGFWESHYTGLKSVEWRSLVEKFQKHFGQLSDSARLMFRSHVDTNNDGVVTVYEWYRFLHKHGEDPSKWTFLPSDVPAFADGVVKGRTSPRIYFENPADIQDKPDPEDPELGGFEPPQEPVSSPPPALFKLTSFDSSPRRRKHQNSGKFVSSASSSFSSSSASSPRTPASPATATANNFSSASSAAPASSSSSSSSSSSTSSSSSSSSSQPRLDLSFSPVPVPDQLSLRKSIRAHEGAVTAVSCNQHLLFTGASEGIVKIWDLNTLQPLRKKIYAHSGHVTALPSEGNRLFTTGSDGWVKIFDVISQVEVRSIKPSKLPGAFSKFLMLDTFDSSAAASSSTSSSASSGHNPSAPACRVFGAWGQQVLSWDPRMGEVSTAFHCRAVTKMAKTETDLYITGSADGDVNLWDPRSLSLPLATLYKRPTASHHSYTYTHSHVQPQVPGVTDFLLHPEDPQTLFVSVSDEVTGPLIDVWNLRSFHLSASMSPFQTETPAERLRRLEDPVRDCYSSLKWYKGRLLALTRDLDLHVWDVSDVVKYCQEEAENEASRFRAVSLKKGGDDGPVPGDSGDGKSSPELSSPKSSPPPSPSKGGKSPKKGKGKDAATKPKEASPTSAPSFSVDLDLAALQPSLRKTIFGTLLSNNSLLAQHPTSVSGIRTLGQSGTFRNMLSTSLNTRSSSSSLLGAKDPLASTSLLNSTSDSVNSATSPQSPTSATSLSAALSNTHVTSSFDPNMSVSSSVWTADKTSTFNVHHSRYSQEKVRKSVRKLERTVERENLKNVMWLERERRLVDMLITPNEGKVVSLHGDAFLHVWV